MSCNGPDYEHMDKQGIVALITGDNKKEADEAVEDEIGVSQPSKCPFSHAEAMQKIDNYLAYSCCKLEATPLKMCQNLSNSSSFLLRIEKALSNILPFLLFSKRNLNLVKLLTV